MGIDFSLCDETLDWLWGYAFKVFLPIWRKCGNHPPRVFAKKADFLFKVISLLTDLMELKTLLVAWCFAYWNEVLVICLLLRTFVPGWLVGLIGWCWTLSGPIFSAGHQIPGRWPWIEYGEPALGYVQDVGFCLFSRKDVGRCFKTELRNVDFPLFFQSHAIRAAAQAAALFS